MDNRESKVPALQRAVAILDYIAERGACQGSALIPVLNAPKSSVYLLLEELKQLRLLSQGTDGLYRLGIKLIEFGEQASGQLDMREIARPHLYALMQETGLLCHLGVIDGDGAYYILKIESQGTIRVRSWEGKRLSLYRSGLGKCLLAWADAEKQSSLISDLEFIQTTPMTIATPEALKVELNTIKTRGWSYDNQEDLLDVRCIACPIFDSSHKIAAAISVVGTSLQIFDEKLAEISEQVMRTAAQISKELGYTG
ncbi:MAG: IclR family transcriptional regulator [Formivibrio sp.]|nr:IclR family transcriptional regulator [Formivibrio sp.]